MKQERKNDNTRQAYLSFFFSEKIKGCTKFSVPIIRREIFKKICFFFFDLCLPPDSGMIIAKQNISVFCPKYFRKTLPKAGMRSSPLNKQQHSAYPNRGNCRTLFRNGKNNKTKQTDKQDEQ